VKFCRRTLSTAVCAENYGGERGGGRLSADVAEDRMTLTRGEGSPDETCKDCGS